MKRINLTQHQSTPAQNCIDLTSSSLKKLKSLLTFTSIPDALEMKSRASLIVALAKKAEAKQAMIGGAPYFMSYLELALKKQNIQPLYAFTKRESREFAVDGKNEKRTIFTHIGYVKC